MTSPAAMIHDDVEPLDIEWPLPAQRLPSDEAGELPLGFFFAFMAALLITIAVGMLGATHSL